MLACSLVTRTCFKTTGGLISGTFRRLTLEVLSPEKTIALLFESYSNFLWLYLLACLKWEDVGTLDSGERSLPFGLLVYSFFYLHRCGKNIFTNKSSSSGIYRYFNSSVRRVKVKQMDLQIYWNTKHILVQSFNWSTRTMSFFQEV